MSKNMRPVKIRWGTGISKFGWTDIDRGELAPGKYHPLKGGITCPIWSCYSSANS